MNLIKTTENGYKYVNFLEKENTHSLLELTAQANFSELPFGMNTTYSSFFNITIGESEKGIYLCVYKVGGCFCEEMYILKLNEFPSEEICFKIQEIVDVLSGNDRRFTTVHNFINHLSRIKDMLIVECVITNNFEKESKKQDAISELRMNIEDSIESAIISFRKKSDLPKERLDEICRIVRNEYK